MKSEYPNSVFVRGEPNVVRRLALVGLSILATASIVACSGGSGAHVAPSLAQGASVVSGKAMLTIPNRVVSSNRRQPKFVSASAISAAIALNGGTPLYVDVSPSSSICAATAGSNGRTCTIPVTAPSGKTTFTVTLYDAPNGGGNKLGSGGATQTIVIGTPFTVALALSGITATVTIAVPVINVGPTSVPVTVIAKDADGNTIIGSAPYSAPITLTNSDTSGVLTLSTTTVNSPNDLVLVTYNGSTLAAPANISATSSGLAPTAITPATVQPYNYFPVNVARLTTTSTASGSTNLFVGSSPTYPPSTPGPTVTTNDTTTIVPGATFGTVTNAIMSTTTGNNSTTISYRALVNGTLIDLGGSGSDAYSNGTYNFGAGRPYLGIPLITAATLTIPPMYSETDTYIDANQSVAFSQTYSFDAAGTYTSTTTYPDGSSEVSTSLADGSGTDVYKAGTTPTTSDQQFGTWGNFMPLNLLSASATVSAPLGGSVTLNVSQMPTTGTAQTSSLVLPLTAIYPNGTPPFGHIETSQVGAPVGALPSTCANAMNSSGPYVPVTLSKVLGFGASFERYDETQIDYYSPGLGVVCSTFASKNTYLRNLGALTTLPLQLSFVLHSFTVAQTTILTAVAPPGKIAIAGHARSSRNEREIRSEMPAPFLRHRFFPGGNR